MLIDIEELYQGLSIMPGKGGGVRRAPGFESQSPARDSVIAAMDLRSVPGHAMVKRNGVEVFDDEVNTSDRSIVAALSGMEAAWREARGLHVLKEPPQLQRAVTFLEEWMPWAAAQSSVDLDGDEHPWFPDVMDELRDLLRRLKGFHGLRPMFIGLCSNLVDGEECGSRLYCTPLLDRDETVEQADRRSTVVCHGCGRTWTRMEWLRLAQNLRRSA